jgi:hypothetical protein
MAVPATPDTPILFTAFLRVTIGLEALGSTLMGMQSDPSEVTHMLRSISH